MITLDDIPNIKDADRLVVFALALAQLDYYGNVNTSREGILSRAIQMAIFFSDGDTRIEALQILSAIRDLWDGKTLYRKGMELTP